MSSQTTSRMSKKSEKVATIAPPPPSASASIVIASNKEELGDNMSVDDEDEDDNEEDVIQLEGEHKLDGQLDIGANDSDVDEAAESDNEDDGDDDEDDDEDDDDAFNLDEDGEAPVATTVGKKTSTSKRTKTQIGTSDDMLGLLNMHNDDEDNVSSDDDDKQMNGVMEADEDDEDDDEDLDVYLQKFDEEVNANYLLAEHPNEFNKNYDEIDTLCNLVRDQNNNIIDPLHRTIPYLSKYERTRVLGQRAKQLNSGSKPFVAVPDNIIDGYIIAEIELLQKRIPFIIQRPLHGGVTEYWKLRDLEIL